MAFILKPSAASSHSLLGQQQRPAQPHRPASLLPPCNVASVRAASASVLDRPNVSFAPQTPQTPVQQEQQQEEVQAFVEEGAYAVEAASAGMETWEREFSDYASATEMMNELESLQAELSSNVSSLDTLWLAPQQDPLPSFHREPSPNTEDADRRRAARKASREARKQKQQQAAAQNSSSVQAPTQTTTAATLHPPPQQQQQEQTTVTDEDLESDLASLDDLRHQLSQLWEDEPFSQQQVPSTPAPSAASSPPRSASSAASASRTAAPKRKPSKAQPASVAAASTKQPTTQPPATFATALSLPSETSTALVAPSTARTRHARRADRYSPRTAASSGAATPTSSSNGPKASQTSRATTATDSTAQFMKAASNVALLQGDEQKELATVVKDYLLLMRIKSELKGILKREPSIEEWAKAAKMETGLFSSRLEAGQAAKSVMVKSNYRLVVNIVNKYRNRGMEIHDLIAEGMHGLLRGVEKFDADKGFRFSTYAHWWIRQSVSRAISNQTRAVRVPYHMQELLLKLRSAKAKFQEQHSREPTDDEMAAQLKVPVQRITQAVAAAINPKSLDAQMNDGDDGGGDLKDQLADSRATPEEMFEEEQMQGSVMLVLQELDEREAGIIRMRLGIDGSEVYTLEDIGRTYNVTRERVRQVEAKAMHKLQELVGKGNMGVADYSLSGPGSEKGSLVARSSRGTHKQ